MVISRRMVDPMLRLRMADADADYFYGRLDVPDPASLVSMLRHPGAARRWEPGSAAELAELGARPSSHPNQTRRWIHDAGAAGFTAADTQQTAGASGRRLSRVRGGPASTHRSGTRNALPATSAGEMSPASSTEPSARSTRAILTEDQDR